MQTLKTKMIPFGGIIGEWLKTTPLIFHQYSPNIPRGASKGRRMILRLCPYDYPNIPRLFPGDSFVFSFDTPTPETDYFAMKMI